MTQANPFDQDRVNHVYEWLEEYDALASEAYDDGEKQLSVRQMLDSFVANAAEAAAQSEKIRKSRTTRAIGQLAFLSPYVHGASDEDLKMVMKELKWSLGQPLDAVAKKTVKSYSTLFHLPHSPQLLSESEPELSAPVAPSNGETRATVKDLDGVIFTLVETGAVPESYGGYFRLLFGTAVAPAGVSSEVITMVHGQARGLLRNQLKRTNTEAIDDPTVLQGLRWIREIIQGSNMSVLSKLALEDSGTRRPDGGTHLKSLIASGLETLYATEKTSAE